MNCPQCQERLDERLDEMRLALRSGALTPAAARAQAQTAFDAIISDCPECESELRSHFQLRLSLMTPDAAMASVEVPPSIRLNVRRALEREQLPLPPPRSAWKPLKGFAWTGGAIVSAIALLVVARPFLVERAQQPFPASSTAADSAPPAPMVRQGAPAANAVGNGSAVRVAPPTAAVKKAPATGAIKQAPRSGAATPKPVTRPRVGGATPPSSATADSGSSSFLEIEPPKITVLPSPSTSSAPRPKVRERGDTPRDTRPSPKLSAPPSRTTPKPSAPQPQPEPPAPVVGSAGPSEDYANSTKSTVPTEPRLDPKLQAPSGKELGLMVRFVSPRGEVRANVRSAAPSASFRAVPNKPPEDSVKPEALTPPTSPEAPADSSNTGEAGAKPPVENDTVQKRAPAAPVTVPPITTGSLSISVKKEVVNARVIGEVKGREQKDTVLWTGKASAGKSIPVPLEPLKAVKGDTVIVSFQQQISPSETKTLATDSVVVP